MCEARCVRGPQTKVDRARVEVLDGVQALEHGEEWQAGGRDRCVFDLEKLRARVDERELAEAGEGALHGRDTLPLAADKRESLEVGRQEGDEGAEVRTVRLPELTEAGEVLVVCVEHLGEGKGRNTKHRLALHRQEREKEVADAGSCIREAVALGFVGIHEFG